VIIAGGEALVDLVDDHGALRVVAGGGPFNTAIALGRLDVPVGFLGTISRDPHGEMLAERLVDAGVDTSLVRRSDAPTPHAIVRRHRDGTNEYTFKLGGTSLVDLSPEDLPSLPQEAWAVHVGTLALAVDPPAASYEALVSREAGHRTIILDPNVRPAIVREPIAYRCRFERLARQADIVKLSDDDAAWLYPGAGIRQVLEQLLRCGPRIVALTRGENGAVAATDGAFVDVPGMPIAVVDTVGAGDSFGAALITSLVDEGVLGPQATRPPDEATLKRSVAYAVTASAITCTRTGADPPTRNEIEAHVRDACRRPGR